jgi:predicted nuclease with TOPRIM domain
MAVLEEEMLLLQMQSKFQELQEKLQAEEAEKRELVHKYEEIKISCDQLKDQVNSNQEHRHEEEVCDVFISYFIKKLYFLMMEADGGF